MLRGKIKLKLNKKAKYILGIIFAFLIISSGTIFGLAKTGVIDIKMLADEWQVLTSGTAKGMGLVGTYYQLNLDDTPNGSAGITRADGPYINFPGNSLTPPSPITREHFSVRWTGTVQVPTGGTYTFETVSDDGVKLYINGSLLIDNWTVHGATTNTKTINLSAGTTNIILDYYNSSIDSAITLSWSGPGLAKQLVPFVGSTPPPNNGNFSLNVTLQNANNTAEKLAGGSISGTPNPTVSESGSGVYSATLPFSDLATMSGYKLSFSKSGYTSAEDKSLAALGVDPSAIVSGQSYSATVSLYPLSTNFRIIIQGSIKDTAGKYVTSASVQILDSSTPGIPALASATSSATYWQGINNHPYNYKTGVFALPLQNSFQNKLVRISAAGWQPVTKSLSDGDAFVGSSDSGGISTYQVKDLAFTTADTQSNLMRILGLVTESGTDKLIPGASVTVSCPVAPPAEYTACKTELAKTKWASSVDHATATSASNAHPIFNKNQNYQIDDFYNFAKSTSQVNSLSFEVIKNPTSADDTYFYDSNSDGKKNDNEAIGKAAFTLSRSDVSTPSGGDPKSAVIKNIQFKKYSPASQNVTLLALARAAENNGNLLNATFKITDADSPQTAIAEVHSPDGGGWTSFGDIKNKLSFGKNYQVYAIPDEPGRSIAAQNINFHDGENTLDFSLAINSAGKTIFEGFVYDQNLTPIPNATVQLTEENAGLISLDSIIEQNKTDATGHYRLVVNNINYNAEGTGQILNVRLTALRGWPAFLAKNARSQLYSLNRNGGRIQCNFIFGSNDIVINGNKKDVTVDISKVIRGRKNRTDKAEPDVYNVSNDKFGGLPVKLACSQAVSSPGITNIVSFSDTVTTSSAGIASFHDIPVSNCKILITYDPIWNIQGTLDIPSASTKHSVALWRMNNDPTALENAESRIRFSQTDPNWSSKALQGFESYENMRTNGCCITSLTSAINFYHPEKGITPASLADVGAATGADMHVRYFSEFVPKINKQYGMNLRLVSINRATVEADVKRFLTAGVPVIWYATGNQLAKPGGGKYGTHCVVLTHYSAVKPPIYGLMDAANGQILNYRRDQIGNLGSEWLAYALVDDDKAPITGQPTSINNSIISVAEAAEGAQQAVYLKPLKIKATIKPKSIIPISGLFISTQSANGSWVSIKMTKQTDGSYLGTVPSVLITNNFKYRILAYNYYDARNQSVDYTVTVTNIPNSTLLRNVQTTAANASAALPRIINSVADATKDFANKTLPIFKR